MMDDLHANGQSQTHLVHSNGGIDACSIDLFALDVEPPDRWSHTLHHHLVVVTH